MHVHDLREWTDDVHRTVDDAPVRRRAGHGDAPGAVGAALDARRAAAGDRAAARRADAVRAAVQPGPTRGAGRPSRGWSSRCGRYEGIDARVVERARRRMPVDEVSIGDYVLAGGEAAVLVMVEAVARLLPGFMGNAELARRGVVRHRPDGALLEAPPTPGRRAGAVWTCRPCCSPATTPPSRAGGEDSRGVARPSSRPDLLG